MRVSCWGDGMPLAFCAIVMGMAGCGGQRALRPKVKKDVELLDVSLDEAVLGIRKRYGADVQLDVKESVRRKRLTFGGRQVDAHQALRWVTYLVHADLVVIEGKRANSLVVSHANATGKRLAWPDSSPKDKSIQKFLEGTKISVEWDDSSALEAILAVAATAAMKNDSIKGFSMSTKARKRLANGRIARMTFSSQAMASVLTAVLRPHRCRLVVVDGFVLILEERERAPKNV